MADSYGDAAATAEAQWEGLAQAMAAQVRVDWTTGETDVPDIDTFEQIVLEQIPRANPDGMTRLHALLWDGFAVPPGAPGTEDRGFRVVPWRAITAEDYVLTLRREDWEWLGVDENSAPEDVGGAFRKFPNLPQYLSDEQYWGPIRDAAAAHAQRRNDWIALRDQALPAEAAGGPSGARLLGRRSRPDMDYSRIERPAGGFQFIRPPDDTTSIRQGVGSPPPQPASGPDYAKVAALFGDFVKQVGVCFEQASWSIWWSNGPWSWSNPWTVALGVRICFNKACADKLRDQLGTLAAGVGGIGLAALITQFASGAGFAQLASAAFGALGWVGIALFEFAVYWLIAIATNLGANGVCILHLFPWWIGLEGIYKGRAYPLN